MTKKSLAQIEKDIAALQAKAAKLRQAEKSDVVASIKESILIYDISPKDLFGTRIETAKAATKKVTQVRQYADNKGNHWIGRGPRPDWLRKALEAGKELSDFLVTDTKATAAKPATTKPAAKKTAKSGAKKVANSVPVKTSKAAAKKTAKAARTGSAATAKKQTKKAPPPAAPEAKPKDAAAKA